MKYEMQYVLLQPWSTFVMKTQLPQDVFVKMLRISDEIVENKSDKDGVSTTKKKVGAGQVKDQFFIDLEILEREEILVCVHIMLILHSVNRIHLRNHRKYMHVQLLCG